MPPLEELLRPIKGDNPSGQLLRRTVYPQIREARRADDPGPRGEWTGALKSANYADVERLAVEALTTQTKDVQIAVWLTEALLNRHGIKGLTEGLTLLRLLLEKFWETIYPLPYEGKFESRAAPLDWMGSELTVGIKAIQMTRNGLSFLKYEEARSVGYEHEAANVDRRRARDEAIADGKITAEAFDEAKDATPVSFYEGLVERLKAPLQALDALDQLLLEKFGDPPPNLQPLRGALEEVAHIAGMFVRQKKPAVQETMETSGFAEDSFTELEQPTAEEPTTPEPVKVNKTAARPAASAPQPGSAEEAVARVAQTAEFLRKEDPASAVPYLLLRALRWGELRASGIENSNVLEAPPTETRRQLRDLAQNSDWAAVLTETEAAMAQPWGRAWLDLQRYAAKACDELSYDNAAQAIRSEVKALIADFPNLPKLALADDTPAANPETQAWLDALVKPSQQMPEIGHTILEEESQPAGEKAPDVYETALEAARSGKHQEAVGILTSSAERSGRTRFLRKIQLAQICLATGRDEVAYPILRSIAREIDSRHLEDWEAPEVLAQPLILLFQCLSKMENASPEKQEIYARICCLDPAYAMEFNR